MLAHYSYMERNMYKEKIINLETGEEVIRDYNDEEIAAIEKTQAEEAKRLADFAIRQEARRAILEKLGLTEDEAKVLLG